MRTKDYGGKVLTSGDQQRSIDRIKAKFPGEGYKIDGGICRSLSAYWIINNAKGKNHWWFLNGDKAPDILKSANSPQYEQREKYYKILLDKIPQSDKSIVLKAIGNPTGNEKTITFAQGQILYGILTNPECKTLGPLLDALRAIRASGVKDIEKWKLTNGDLQKLDEHEHMVRTTSSTHIRLKLDLPAPDRVSVAGPGGVARHMCKDGYTTIGFHPADKSVGHAMAAYAHPTEGVFFHDPNTGDRWFPTGVKFHFFFVDYMKKNYDPDGNGTYDLELFEYPGSVPWGLTTEMMGAKAREQDEEEKELARLKSEAMRPKVKPPRPTVRPPKIH